MSYRAVEEEPTIESDIRHSIDQTPTGNTDTQFDPIVKGRRLYLREVRASDVTDKYYRWLNDPEINQYLETRFVPQSFENIAAFVKSMDGKSGEPFFAICTIDGEEHIGNIKLGPVNWLHRRGEVSLLIGEKSQWGKGYASEAISLITRYGFQTLNLSKLEAGCYQANEGSARAFEKCGYQREGLLRDHFLSQGQPTGAILLGITAVEYFRRQQ